jgi:hypothetical protein
MTSELTPRIKELCLRITEEKDPKNFQQLVEELNQVLEEKGTDTHERCDVNYLPASRPLFFVGSETVVFFKL